MRIQIYILYNYELYKIHGKHLYVQVFFNFFTNKIFFIFLVEKYFSWLIKKDLSHIFIIILKIYKINLNF